MDGTVTISLKDFKELEEAAEKLKKLEKEIVVFGRVRKSEEEHEIMVHKKGVEEFLKSHYNVEKIEWDEGFDTLKMYEFGKEEKTWVVAKGKKEAETYYNKEYMGIEEGEKEAKGKEIKRSTDIQVIDEDTKEEVSIWELAEREYNEWAQIPFLVPAVEKKGR